MAQQHSTFSSGFHGQGPETDYDIPIFQGGLTQIGPAAMDRGQLSNNSYSTENSDSAWTTISWNSNLSESSAMSGWQKVPPNLKWEDGPYGNSYNLEDNVDKMEHSPTSSQSFVTPVLQQSSFIEPAIDPRPTPTSLGWTPHCRLLELYKFVVGKGAKDPYFQLLEGCQVTDQTPERVFLDHPRPSKKGAYPCQYPWRCTGKQTLFSRPADLERHYKNVHAPPDQKDSFPCDYSKCSRSREVFTRKDHYRDHLRDYHHEDLGSTGARKKSGKRGGAAEQEARVSSRWWRCARCLKRRQVHEDGYECPNCKLPCEQERIDIRTKQGSRSRTTIPEPADVNYEASEYQTASSATATVTGAEVVAGTPTFEECGTCSREYPGWMNNGIDWVVCPECVPIVAEASTSSYAVDDYQQPSWGKAL